MSFGFNSVLEMRKPMKNIISPRIPRMKLVMIVSQPKTLINISHIEFSNPWMFSAKRLRVIWKSQKKSTKTTPFSSGHSEIQQAPEKMLPHSCLSLKKSETIILNGVPWRRLFMIPCLYLLYVIFHLLIAIRLVS